MIIFYSEVKIRNLRTFLILFGEVLLLAACSSLKKPYDPQKNFRKNFKPITVFSGRF